MAGILAQLGGNPFNTAVGQKIEQATDGSLASENWALNMEICDIINDTDEGPKDAVKAIRKRLQQNAGKNYTVVMYTLTVLETCVKNCGKRFHLLVTQKDFVQELVKLIGPKNDPPTAVQEKVLSLIQSWAEAFQVNPEMQGVVQMYADLKQKGIEFPVCDMDSTAPIHTPQRSVPMTQPVKFQPSERTPQKSTLTSRGTSLTPQQLVKLRSELDVVQGNMRVFGEMLTELIPGKEHPSDFELLQDLHKTCRAMQSRIVELIDRVGNEEVTGELLQVNDELNNLFLRYERFEKKRAAVNQSQPPQQATEEPRPLIDLGENEETSPDDIQVQLAGMGLNNGSASSTSVKKALSRGNSQTSNDEFDMLAQSRTLGAEYRKSSGNADTKSDQAGGSLGINGQQLEPEDTAVPQGDREQDFNEMERWLQDKPESEQEQQESITSTEFDRFLGERAAAAERLPTVTTRGHQ